jgi:hypothetical protein
VRSSAKLLIGYRNNSVLVSNTLFSQEGVYYFVLLALRKEERMKTFEELKAVLTQDLLTLERLAQSWSSTIHQRDVKEQEIGRHCYEAEEDLNPLELNMLKRMLSITDTRWQAYKAKFIEGSSSGEWT